MVRRMKYETRRSSARIWASPTDDISAEELGGVALIMR